MRSNRVLKNIIKDQDLFHAAREFCMMLSHRQRGRKNEIAKLKELPEYLLVTKKLHTRNPIVKGELSCRIHKIAFENYVTIANSEHSRAWLAEKGG